MAWDERGRLWVLETKDYPNNPQPSGQGNDALKILEDTNRDGRADKSTIFADKLSIPSGMVFARGGVIVAQAGEFIFLKDTNGDDKADVRETIMTGWGVRDTHAVASNLKYGIDNWLYGAVGYSGFDGVIEGKPLRFQQALYRFSADGKRMQHMANFTNNTWGLGLQRDERPVRVDGQQRPQLLRADHAAPLPGRARPERPRPEEDRRPLRDARQHAEDPPGGRAWADSRPSPGTTSTRRARSRRSTGTAWPS